MTRTSPLLTAVAIRQALAEGTLSVQQVAQAHLERIEQLEPQLRAWRSFRPDAVLRQARELDQQRAAGQPLGLLAGVPLAVKDLFDTFDHPTAYGSAVYEHHQPTQDARAVLQARQAGVLVMGKTVTTEFAYFTPGPTANPWNTAHTPGGSSSGSAAAVASGMVPLAFGSQTAGSLIRPASYCGVFALKPTYGVFSTRGAKEFAPSLDTLGWLARSPDDLELMRCALAGIPFVPLQPVGSTALRLAACQTHEWPASDAGGAEAWHRALAKAARSGLPVQPVAMPESLAGLLQAQKDVMAYEAARHLAAELRDHPAQLSEAIKALLLTGQGITSERYQAGLALARSGRDQVLQLMEGADALLVPAAPGEAPQGLAATGDPVFSRVWTLMGFPCVSVPGLLGPQGLPIGLQLVGRHGQERELLEAAATLHTVVDEGGTAPPPRLT